jgi:hypothetical protein
MALMSKVSGIPSVKFQDSNFKQATDVSSYITLLIIQASN